jgi:hypothetical protein
VADEPPKLDYATPPLRKPPPRFAVMFVLGLVAYALYKLARFHLRV